MEQPALLVAPALSAHFAAVPLAILAPLLPSSVAMRCTVALLLLALALVCAATFTAASSAGTKHA